MLTQEAPSVFVYNHIVGDRTWRAVFGAFVDDHLMVGHVKALYPMIHRFTTGDDKFQYDDLPARIQHIIGMRMSWTAALDSITFHMLCLEFGLRLALSVVKSWRRTAGPHFGLAQSWLLRARGWRGLLWERRRRCAGVGDNPS